MKRYAHVIEVREDKVEEYKILHSAAWPEVLQQIRKSNIQDYSIFLKQLPDGRYYLFSYFIYAGLDFDADMASMAADPRTQEWWALCKPCQRPLADVDTASGGWWSIMEEVFHTE